MINEQYEADFRKEIAARNLLRRANDPHGAGVERLGRGTTNSVRVSDSIFAVKNGSLQIVDPCYRKRDGVFMAARNGMWTVRRSDEFLIASHFEATSGRAITVGTVGADSGQLGIYDLGTFTGGSNRGAYHVACALTQGGLHGGAIPSKTFGNSGYVFSGCGGDGSYTIYGNLEDQ